MSKNTTAQKATGPVTVTDPKRDAQAREQLVTARIGLLLRAPFFGNLATRLELVNADEWCPTAATDGRKFYYNSEFICKLPRKQVEFLFGHEVLHNVYDHLGRRGVRDPRISNIAQDYCVNSDLIEQRIGERITVVDILYDKKYKDWSWEEVYDDLMQNAQRINIDDLLDRMVDEHLEGDGSGDDGDDSEDGDRNGRGRPRISEAERQQIRDEIKQAMIQAAQAAGADNLPGGVKRLIKDLTAPQMDWRELLQQQIESIVKSDFSWMRPSRRSWHMDAVMPGMINGTTIEVFVGIDTSGSITNEDLRCFLSEVQGIMDSYDQYSVKIVTWDTAVHNPAEFTSENMQSILEYVPGGGGGTDPHCVWEYLKEHDIQPKKLIMFTDYQFWGWRPQEVENYCDTVWIIKGNKDATPEFGVFAHYDGDRGSKR
jgi:predicted metal-dependent peptidase